MPKSLSKHQNLISLLGISILIFISFLSLADTGRKSLISNNTSSSVVIKQETGVIKNQSQDGTSKIGVGFDNKIALSSAYTEQRIKALQKALRTIHLVYLEANPLYAPFQNKAIPIFAMTGSSFEKFFGGFTLGMGMIAFLNLLKLIKKRSTYVIKSGNFEKEKQIIFRSLSPPGILKSYMNTKTPPWRGSAVYD